MIDIIIPTYKPNKDFIVLIDKLQKQSIKPNKIILMNTEEKYIQKFHISVCLSANVIMSLLS